MARRQEYTLKNKIVSFVVILVTALAMVVAAAGIGIYQAIHVNTFYDGVSVDGIVIGGMTYDEAKNALRSREEELLMDARITVSYDDQKTTMDAEELGISTNLDSILKNAFTEGAQAKPLDQKYDDIIEMTEGKDFSIQLELDDTKLHNTIKKYSDDTQLRAKEATAKFDKHADKFIYTQSENGRKIDAESLYEQLKQKIAEEDFSDISVLGKVVLPEVSTDELKENTALIGSCNTKITANENRNTNIRLMCEAVDGLKLDPGQTLSINDLVGERTAEKGFKSAPAIMDGTKLVDDMGGGICQLSGTLYNAALKANMEIVERVHHTWPSTYLPIGLDATLNWDDKDLKIKNTSEWPIYISAELVSGECVVKIYGQPLPEGIELEIRTEMLEEIDPPKPDIIYTDDLPNGERQVKVTARKGYKVKAYRDYYENDKLIKSELISDDYFHEIQGVILEGSNAKAK